MINNRIFNNILTKNRTDYSKITSLMENAYKDIFFKENIQYDGIFNNQNYENDSSNTNLKLDESLQGDIKVETFKDYENIKIISANRSEMELNSITKIIPIVRGKYDSISEFIDRHNRLLNSNRNNKKELFIFNLAKKRSIASTPNTFNKDYIMMKSFQLPITTITSNAINALALGSFQMMSTILTSTFGSFISLAVTFISVILTVRKKGGSRQFIRFTIGLLVSQLIVTIIAIVITAFFWGIKYCFIVGIILICIFSLFNQIGKAVIQHYDRKVAMKIEKMYDGCLYSRVRNRINNQH